MGESHVYFGNLLRMMVSNYWRNGLLDNTQLLHAIYCNKTVYSYGSI